MVKLFSVKGLTYWSFSGERNPQVEDAAIRIGKDMAANGVWGIELDAKEVTNAKGADAGQADAVRHF